MQRCDKDRIFPHLVKFFNVAFVDGMGEGYGKYFLIGDRRGKADLAAIQVGEYKALPQR